MEWEINTLVPNSEFPINEDDVERRSNTNVFCDDSVVEEHTSYAKINENQSLDDKLRQWYLKHRPPRACVEDLVNILREEQLNVSSFYKFRNSTTAVIESIAGGSYLHIGFALQLNKIGNW